MKRKNSDNKYIYIVLVKAHTGLGKFVRTFSKYEYTHIAVSLDESLDKFITFSRKKHYAPFDSGFMYETLDCYAYGDYKEVKLKIFKLTVKEENLEKIKSYILKIENDKDYIFNIYSMATMNIIHGFRIYKAHNCMSFTAKILELSNSIQMSKKYYRYSIKDMDNLLKDYKYIEKQFSKEKIENKNYMDKVKLLDNIKMFFRLNKKLLYRMFFKRGLIKDEE